MQINAENLVYIPILAQKDQMERYIQNEFLEMIMSVYTEFYPRIGYHPPWIGYLALHDQVCVGVGGFKGPPKSNTIEIAYGTVPEYEGLGISSQTCKFLTHLALTEDPGLKVTARTLMSESASTNILRKNHFVLAGIVDDPEDGEVWEWVYQPEAA